ncbi:MAG: hypothetical protein Q8928_01090 [Bacteroidota bacterium]|nr:hypothetical protein [Bacteroidota bacterium]
MKPRPSTPADNAKKSSEKQLAQFNIFPEGGNLVSGLPCNLAFKAVNKDGMPVDVHGTLFDDTIPITRFKSSHAGMGAFLFTPLPDKKYRIRLSEPANDTTFRLPEIYPQGISLQLSSRNKDFLEFIVSQSTPFTKRKVYLRGQIRGVVYCIASGTLNKDLTIKIPLKEFPDQGIAEFTLFNDSLMPIAERLVYINPERKLNIETKLNKEHYETREKVLLSIKVTDQSGQPVVANLGVNVYDKLYQSPVESQNILSHCYLSSQLKGKIYDPAYYFDNKNKDCEEALDLLLLTQGWRRYVWSEPALKEFPNIRQPIIFDGIKGIVKVVKKQKAAQGIQQFIMAFNPDKKETNNLIEVDSTDKFTVTPQHFKLWQGSYIYFKPMTSEEFRPRISISDPFRIINEKTKYKEINYPLPKLIVKNVEDPFSPVVDGHNSIKLAEVTVKGRGVATFRDKYIGHLDSLAKLDMCFDYVGKCGLLNCPVCKDGTKPIEGKRYFKWIGNRYPGPHPFAYKNEEEEDLVYHYPNFTEEELLKMNNLSRIKAYYSKREFYQPNYDKDPGDIQIPDFRNTLLWQPNVITDQKGEATLEFFCSDINTGFTGKIEGVNGDGLLGSKDFDFFVVKRKIANPLK